MKNPALWHACIVIVAMGCIGSSLSLAQSTTDCSSVVNDAARLKCYDEQAARQKRQVAPPSGATAATPTPAKPTPPSVRSTPPAHAESAPASPNDFGLEPDAIRKKQAAANPDAPQAPEQLVARVKTVATKSRGTYRITLEDGQVWEETQHTGGLPPEIGETVTIRRGMLGSYFLSRSFGLALRVKRVD
jgi:hypothetical protein